MDVIELILDENSELSGVEAISLVESPAIEEDFVALKSHKVEFKTIDEEKRIVIGLALVPDKLIYRRDGDYEYNIFFSKKTVRDIAYKWIKENNNNNATLEHQLSVDGVSFVETWIVEDPKTDKTKLYGLNAVEGSWAVIGKIENDDVWEDVKAKRYKGLSIEGYFADKLDRPKESIEEELCKDCFEELQAEYALLEAAAVLEEQVELESYGGYPESASNNAKLGIKRNKELGNKCATQVGKVRAQQLARKEKFTVPTLKRIYSYLSRAEAYYDASKPKACGTISYLLWGGKSMKNWVESKLRGLDKLEAVDMAEVGPRGGVRKSPKAPKSDTPNKNPKGEGTAKGDASGKTGAKVSQKDEAALKKKADDFNERYKEKLGYGITVGMLKSVLQRGLGAFNTSHSPNVKSATQWAHARVNAFMYLVRNGRPENAKYTTDYDLLPAKHPKSSKNA